MTTTDREPVYICVNNDSGKRLKSFKGAWDKKGTVTIVVEIDDPGDYGYMLARLMEADAAPKRPAKKGGAA